MLTSVIRHPLRGPEVLGLLPPIPLASFALTRSLLAASRPGSPLDRHERSELPRGMARETTHQPVMGDHAAILVDHDGAATFQARAVEPPVAHKHPPLDALILLSVAKNVSW
ncbi:hypothetical protein SHO565_45490 [Streptomyces sp. HO565]